ncbi:MAG: hypothetical protein R3C10_23590 [Pirellulales bacterium]
MPIITCKNSESDVGSEERTVREMQGDFVGEGLPATLSGESRFRKVNCRDTDGPNVTSKKVNPRDSPLRQYCCWLFVPGSSSPPSASGGMFGNAICLVAGVLFTLVVASVLEWLVHRYIYHRRSWGPRWPRSFASTTRDITSLSFPPGGTHDKRGRAAASDPQTLTFRDFASTGRHNMISKSAHFAFYMAIGFLCLSGRPAWLLTHNWSFTAGVVATSIVVSDLFVRVHDAIHYPGQFRLIRDAAVVSLSRPTPLYPSRGH